MEDVMLCRHGIRLRGSFCFGRSRFVHETDGVKCEPDADLSWARVEKLFAGLRQVHGVEPIPGRIQ